MNRRAHTDIRFGILVAAVLATGFFAFSVVGAASPGVSRISAEQVRPCMAGIDERTSGFTDPGLALRAKLALANECQRPFTRAQVRWVAAGLLATSVLTVVLYLLHPWWLVRSRRMRPLTDPDVVAELDRLATEAGLEPAPEWLLGPYSAAGGGQAFGLPWCYRVCLDVGLLVRYELDLDGFRSVVRHELAHLTNRDVGRTYLTVALWWSFVVLAVSPFVAVTLNPGVLRDQLGWTADAEGRSSPQVAYRMIALLVLTLTGFLLRNAILRAREVCADATAAGVPGAGPALTRVLRQLPWPPRIRRRVVPERLARLGPHPPPAERIAAVGEPATPVATTWWELTGLGFMVGLALNDVGLLVGNLLEGYLAVGLLLLALPVAVLLVGILANALSRPGRPAHAVLTLPAGPAVGFAAGELLNLMVTYNDVLTPLDHGPVAFVLSVVVLVLLTTVIAVWLRSVRRHRPEGTRGRLVTAAAMVIAAPLIAVWFAVTYGSNSFGQFDLTVLPETGLAVDWYRELSRWLNALTFYLPAARLGATPFLAIGLALLWAVPLAVCGRRRIDVRRAVWIGALLGAFALVAAVALPFLAGWVLPAEVRRTPTDGAPLAVTFTTEYGLAYCASAALLAALAAGLVAATSSALRPVLVPLAFSVTAVLATIGFSLTRTMSRCLEVDDALVRSCVPEVPGAGSATVFHLHLILVWGAAVAVPSAFAGAGLGVLVRRRRPRAAGPLVHRSSHWRAASGLGLVAALFPSAAALAVPYDLRSWKPAPRPEIPPPAAAAAVDECLLGSWREAAVRSRTTVDGQAAELTGGGAIQTFRPDGTATLDFGSGVTRSTTAGGHRYDMTMTGRLIMSYRVDGSVIGYSASRVDLAGTTTLRIDGVVRNRTGLESGVLDDRYVCAGNHLHESSAVAGHDYDIDLVRR
ncbi:hypothetical protein GCM10010172_64710 [Paractinoplanes ferrugineus]|uniref:Peptidase M48 domain-containing protein n=1 Tax=Paractinoplanes ferrugineus TaxID=113564 RepID=A0A919J9D1_9ACTN|nr:M48 family metalloprotease [Actinoplanes ferrugineus]GIE15959.1 hypothetical protein Afe05nite_77990 [Actinoplanes ferrugineus]